MIWPNIETFEDNCGDVKKLVFSHSDAIAEAVLYKYPDYKTRTVICCSTQSGCPIGCRFCGAGDYFVRSLRAREIVAQVDYCLSQQIDCHPSDIERLQIMFMAMGEPLLNVKELVPAIYQLNELWPNAALLISTSAPDVDYAPIFDVSKNVPAVGLQFSVHESTNPRRNALIPFQKKLDLRQIADVGARWHEHVGRAPFFNYCAHDENSSDGDADRLLELFDPSIWCATVSVISERTEGLSATNSHQRFLASSFADKLIERGFDTRMFDPAGQDTIGGGCGQLWFVQRWMKERPIIAKPSAGYGKQEVHTPTDIQ